MDTISLIWKIGFVIHLISNAMFLGISFVFSYGNKEILQEKIVKRYTKIASLFIFLSGISGIGLLSILSMNGMDNLTTTSSGWSILVMISGYLIVTFVFSLTLIYKGGEEKIYKSLYSIMFHIYLFVYLIRGFLV